MTITPGLPQHIFSHLKVQFQLLDLLFQGALTHPHSFCLAETYRNIVWDLL